MKKAILIIILASILNEGLTQRNSNFSIDIFALPVVAPMNNLNDQYLVKSDSRISLLDKYVTSSEFGLGVNYTYTEKITFGLGVSHKRYNYQIGTYFDILNGANTADDNTSMGAIRYENSFALKAIGIRALASFKLGERQHTKLSLVLEINKPYDFSYSNNLLQRGNLRVSNFVYNETFSDEIKSIKHYIIPEIHFSTQIYKNLALTYGMKLKFWGKENLYELDIYETGHEKFPSFSYEIDTRQLALFVGLTYTFQLPKIKR